MRTAVLLLAAGMCAAQTIEERGSAAWPTANHYRFRFTTAAPTGSPALAEAKLPTGLNPDSIRVLAEGGSAPLPSKTDWRAPDARVAFRSTGAAAYYVYFDKSGNGETARLVEPAMIGAGDRVTYGRAGVRGKLAVGLWAYPGALDIDADGDLDIIVACADRPYNGIYLFRNTGTQAAPLYDRAEWLGPAKKDLVVADANGDGRLDLAYPGGYFDDVARNRLARPVSLPLQRSYHVGRDDMWHPFDWDGDGRIDILNGISDWRDYGWDDAYNEKGEWTNGPLHGYIWLHRNAGTNAAPRYEPPVMLEAGGKPIDLYGSPAPNPVDWFGRGVYDLIGGSFLDDVTLFRNTGTRTAPRLAAGTPVMVNGKPLRMDLCMIQPRTVAWHGDRRPSLLVGEEDGTVALIENTAPAGSEPRLAPPRYLEQVDPFLKSGALARPVAVDWNGDGKLDIVAGNSAGYLQYFENTGTREEPAFTDRGYLEAAGKVIRHLAGPNLSIQGPAEAKWGYTNLSVADWDLDGDLDILVNDIIGAVTWYENTGTRTNPRLAAAKNVEVEWTGRPPKPEWNWWEPKGRQLVTQWRTTPKVVDWDRDGLPDLVMLNHQGYLSLYRRARRDGKLVLLPPERIFVEPGGRFLNLAAGRAGRSGRRKIETVDWDNDGDLDLVSDSDEGPVWYENVGTQGRPVMQARGTILEAPLRGHNPTPNVADWNGDGKLDLIIGAEDGFLYYFERSFIEANSRRAARAWFPTPDHEGGWRARLDPRFDPVFDYLKKTTAHGGLVVIHKGWLVYERYFGKGHREAAPNSASVSKAVTSIALGILMAERPQLFPQGLDSKVLTPAYLPAPAFPLNDPRKADIKLGQLLAFTAGIRGNNPSYVRGKPVTIDPAGPDGWQAMVDETAFETGLWCDPGGGYSYATASIHLVSVLIRHAAGMELEQFVRERIGQPLGWQPFTYGYKDSPLKRTPGGGGVCLRATDWARFGYLLLNRGMWNGRQVVPAEYVRQATAASPYNPHYAYSLQFDVNTNGHYANLPRDAFWKGGSGGHVVYVVPSRDLVVVKMGGRDNQYAMANTGLPEAPSSEANPEKPSVDSREATVETLRRVLALVD